MRRRWRSGILKAFSGLWRDIACGCSRRTGNGRTGWLCWFIPLISIVFALDWRSTTGRRPRRRAISRWCTISWRRAISSWRARHALPFLWRFSSRARCLCSNRWRRISFSRRCRRRCRSCPCIFPSPRVILALTQQLLLLLLLQKRLSTVPSTHFLPSSILPLPLSSFESRSVVGTQVLYVLALVAIFLALVLVQAVQKWSFKWRLLRALTSSRSSSSFLTVSMSSALDSLAN